MSNEEVTLNSISRRPTEKGNPAINFTLAGKHLLKAAIWRHYAYAQSRALFVAVLRHIQTVLRAVAAGLCTCHHMLVLRELFTSCRAIATTFGTTLQHVFRERTISCAQGCTCLAGLCTIAAELSRFLVFYLAIGHHLQTITEAAITLDLTSRAYLGTLLHHPVIFLVLSSSDHWHERGKCHHCD